MQHCVVCYNANLLQHPNGTKMRIMMIFIIFFYYRICNVNMVALCNNHKHIKKKNNTKSQLDSPYQVILKQCHHPHLLSCLGIPITSHSKTLLVLLFRKPSPKAVVWKAIRKSFLGIVCFKNDFQYQQLSTNPRFGLGWFAGRRNQTKPHRFL